MFNDNYINPQTHILLNGRILVKVPKLDRSDTKTAGGIILPSATVEKEEREAIKGELLSTSEFAFCDKILKSDGTWAIIPWKQKPEVGDIVYFIPYAGRVYDTEEDVLYRNMSSKDLTGFEKNINNKQE